jgi:hypothetical protein
MTAGMLIKLQTLLQHFIRDEQIKTSRLLQHPQ